MSKTTCVVGVILCALILFFFGVLHLPKTPRLVLSNLSADKQAGHVM